VAQVAKCSDHKSIYLVYTREIPPRIGTRLSVIVQRLVILTKILKFLSRIKAFGLSMCGIAGFLTIRSQPNQEIRRTALNMSEAIKHRGPDGDGVWTDAEQGIALSHRRLAIVDLSQAGSQPMISGCGNLVMVYNGEIYNANELRDELAWTGIKFKGSSDTEVILEGFARWGTRKTVEKLIGMFAMAVWNRKERALTLVRDRLGIKPLYWSRTTKGSLIFGSELKALRQHPDCPTELNRNAIAGYIRNCYINNPATIYQGVNQLQPGRIMHFAAGADEPTFEQYWSLKGVVASGQKTPFHGNDQEAIAELDSLLGDAVNRRMVADVPLGAFLSGGIDSSAVVALMQKMKRNMTNLATLQQLQNTWAPTTPNSSSQQKMRLMSYPTYQRCTTSHLQTLHKYPHFLSPS